MLKLVLMGINIFSCCQCNESPHYIVSFKFYAII
jgi:hypothetical protein